MEQLTRMSMSVFSDFKAHVLECYPEEACGLIRNGLYVPCKNIATDPTKAFKIAAENLIEPYEAVLHSHPYLLGDDSFKGNNNPAWPSARDIEMFNQGNVPWGIVSTDGEGISQIIWLFDTTSTPVLGREFAFGAQDCYSTVRDWYFQNYGLLLHNYPRQADFWNEGQDLYSQYVEAGFYEIKEEEADVGDAVLMKIVSPVPNHAAVISGNNEITHHLFHRLSETDRLNKWRKLVVKYLRHDHVKNYSPL